MLLDEQVGLRIKLAREAIVLSVDEFAQMIGITARTLGDIEAGLARPSPELLIAIADRLGAPISFFFSTIMDI